MRRMKLKVWIGYQILNLDDWFAKKGIYFNFFNKGDPDHISFLALFGFWLVGWYKWM